MYISISEQSPGQDNDFDMHPKKAAVKLNSLDAVERRRGRMAVGLVTQTQGFLHLLQRLGKRLLKIVVLCKNVSVKK